MSNSCTISFVGDTTLKQWVKELADKEERSYSWVISRVLHLVRQNPQLTEQAIKVGVQNVK